MKEIVAFAIGIATFAIAACASFGTTADTPPLDAGPGTPEGGAMTDAPATEGGAEGGVAKGCSGVTGTIMARIGGRGAGAFIPPMIGVQGANWKAKPALA